MNDNLARNLSIIEKKVRALEWTADRLSEATDKVFAEEDFTVNVDFARHLHGLPKALSETLMSLKRLGQTTAYAVAEDSGRSRSLEYARLNRLCDLGYVQKTRIGRFAYFRLFGRTDWKRLAAKNQEGRQAAPTDPLVD
jgi:predicted transcriptional regulator